MSETARATAQDSSPHLPWVERAAVGIELLSVLIIVFAIVLATVRYGHGLLLRRRAPDLYSVYRRSIAKALLLGLEVLVAADTIRTVLLEPTAAHVLVLGLLVLIRTFLNWSLVLEVEERWPWQARPEPLHDAGAPTRERSR